MDHTLPMDNGSLNMCKRPGQQFSDSAEGQYREKYWKPCEEMTHVDGGKMFSEYKK